MSDFGFMKRILRYIKGTQCRFTRTKTWYSWDTVTATGQDAKKPDAPQLDFAFFLDIIPFCSLPSDSLQSQNHLQKLNTKLWQLLLKNSRGSLLFSRTSMSLNSVQCFFTATICHPCISVQTQLCTIDRSILTLTSTTSVNKLPLDWLRLNTSLLLFSSLISSLNRWRGDYFLTWDPNSESLKSPTPNLRGRE